MTKSSACARSADIGKVNGDLLMILDRVYPLLASESHHVDLVGHVCSGGHPVFIEPYMCNSCYICYPI